MIDLAGLRSVHVDHARRTARAEGGATWSEFDRETQAFGLATTGGAISHTGIGGLTLGGGLGWLAGQYGLACDNLVSVDLVTADGTMVTATATDNPELFWGLRGGGGNFGIVTSFETGCTRSALCWPDQCSTRLPRRGRRSRSTATSRPRYRTRSTRWRR